MFGGLLGRRGIIFYLCIPGGSFGCLSQTPLCLESNRRGGCCRNGGCLADYSDRPTAAACSEPAAPVSRGPLGSPTCHNVLEPSRFHTRFRSGLDLALDDQEFRFEVCS